MPTLEITAAVLRYKRRRIKQDPAGRARLDAEVFEPDYRRGRVGRIAYQRLWVCRFCKAVCAPKMMHTYDDGTPPLMCSACWRSFARYRNLRDSGYWDARGKERRKLDSLVALEITAKKVVRETRRRRKHGVDAADIHDPKVKRGRPYIGVAQGHTCFYCRGSHYDRSGFFPVKGVYGSGNTAEANGWVCSDCMQQAADLLWKASGRPYQ